MIRATDEKKAEQRKVKSDVEQFLANGGAITELPGFGCQPTLKTFSAKEFYITASPRKTKPEVIQAIRADLAAGLTTREASRRNGVSIWTVRNYAIK